MKVSVLDTMEQFLAVKQDWDELYEKDTEATIQRSWHWTKGWIESTTFRWFIIAVQSIRDLRYRGLVTFGLSQPDSNGKRKLVFGGHPLSAHTGFVCDPAHETRITRIVAKCLKENGFCDKIVIADALDGRLTQFLRAFNPLRYRITEKLPTACPYLVLPGDWSSYVEDTLGPETSRTIQKKLRRLARHEGFRQVVADKDTLDECIRVALSLRARKWGEQPEQWSKEVQSIFKCCFDSGSLYASVIYLADTPVAALIGFMDWKKKTFSCFMTGHDENFRKLSLGNLIIAKSIEFAIESGFRTYDLGRGQCQYKYSLGCVDRYNKNYVVRKRTWASVWRILPRHAIETTSSISRSPAA